MKIEPETKELKINEKNMQTELFRKLWKLERANYFVLEGSRLWTLKYKTTFSYLNTLASLSRGTHGVSSGT